MSSASRKYESNQAQERDSTASHPSASAPDPSTAGSVDQSSASASSQVGSTTTTTARQDAIASSGQSSTHAAPSPQLSSLTSSLQQALRQFKDFPTPGILFEDICPIFRNPSTLNDLITALELFIDPANGGPGKPDLIVGLDARGFLMGPALALRIGCGFAPVRKKGKLPGKVERASFKKEYGEDVFEIQSDAVEKGQRVLVIDDIIATGGSASAAGTLVRRLGGDLIGYVFLLELDFLKGRDQLDAPVWTLLTGQKK